MRITRRFLTVTAFMAVLSGQGWAQIVPRPLSRDIYTRLKPAVEEPTARVAERIRALDDESAATRRNARQALLAMGAAIQPQLRWALEAENRKKEANPAMLVRARAELMGLISTLDDERYAKTTMVTLHRKDAPLIDTLREFGVQVDAGVVKISGNTLADKLEWLDSAKVSLDIEKLDYWSALRAIRAQLGFIEDLPSDNLFFHRLRQSEGYMREDPKQMPYDVEGAIVAGPLLIAPSPLDTRGQNLVLTLLALPEARLADKLNHAGNYAVLQIDEYKDDRGQSLLPSGQPLVFGKTSLDRSNDAERLWKWRIEALLPWPAAGRRIGSLKGRFGVSTGPPQTEVVVVDLTRGTGQLFEFDGGVSVLVTSVVPSESTYTFTGEMRAPTNSPTARILLEGDAESHLGLRDKTGAGLRRNTGPVSVRSQAGMTTMTWTLSAPALRQADGIPRSAPPPGGTIMQCTASCVPAALVWLTWPDTHWLQTPFELRDIPLPAPGR